MKEMIFYNFKNILMTIFFFYITYDLLTALFMYKTHPKANKEYYDQVFSMTGVICLMISLIMTILLYSNLVCIDKTA